MTKNWLIRAKTIYEYHNRLLETHGQAYKSNAGWSFRNTANELKLNHTVVHRYYRAYKLVLQFPEYEHESYTRIMTLINDPALRNVLRMEG